MDDENDTNPFSIGVYNLSGSKVIWGFADYDENTEADFSKAIKLYQHLINTGFHPLAELSGGGFFKIHIWLFSDETEAMYMKNFFKNEAFLCAAEPHEIFPKQENVEHGHYGSCGKLPLGINLSTDKFSQILDDDFKPITDPEKIIQRLQYQFDNRDSIPELESLQIKKENKIITTAENEPINLDQLKEALSFIPPDDYDIWIKIGMAMKNHSNNLFTIWDEWSKKSTKYQSQDYNLKKWESFDEKESNEKKLTIGTVFFHAKEVGWKTNRDETIDDYMGIKCFNNETRVFIKKEFYQNISRYIKGEGTYYTNDYKVYEGDLGAGNRPIIIKSQDFLSLGDHKLYLRQMSEEQISELIQDFPHEAINNFCKILKIKSREFFEEGINSITKIKRKQFFTLMLPVGKQELQNIGNPLECCTNILKCGMEKDPKLVYTYISTIPEVNPLKINPRDYQKYAPHQIIITNQKVGKSYNAQVIANEPAVEKPSEAGLLGFATAEKKVYGDLHGRRKQIFLDEISEEKGDELFGKLHTLMETGETKISRGVGIIVSSHCGITIQGNPKDKTNSDNNLETYLTFKAFRDLITKISKNVKPFASRIAVTIFDTNLIKVSGTPDANTQEFGIKIIRSLAEGYKDEFTQLFKDNEILVFLNTPFETDYKKTIEHILPDCHDPLIKDYFEGQIDSFRHCNGMALRLAWLDTGLPNLWRNNSIDNIQLIQSAKKHLGSIQKHNLDSYANILSLINSDSYNVIPKYSLKNIKPEYVRLMVYTFFEWRMNNLESIEKILPLSEIENYFDKVKTNLKIESDSKYRSFSTIKKYISDFKMSSNRIIDLGLEFDHQVNGLIIVDPNKVKQYLDFYKEIFQDTKDTKVTEKIKVTKDTKVTETDIINNKSVTFVTCNLDLQETLSNIWLTNKCVKGLLHSEWIDLGKQQGINLSEGCKAIIVNQI